MRTRGRGYSPFWFSVWTVIIAIAASLIVLNSIQNRSYKAQIILKVPESRFTYWNWPFSGWHLYNADLSVMSRSGFLLKNLDGKIIPKLWNLAMGCSSGSDVSLEGVSVTLPDKGSLVAGLRSLFAELSFSKNKFHKYVCHSTYFTFEKSEVLFENQRQSAVFIKKLTAKKTDLPVVQVEGNFTNENPFGVTITYKPIEDTAFFSADFGQQRAHFDGQVEAFSSANDSFLTGEVHYPANTLTIGNAASGALSTVGTFSINAELSGHLLDLVPELWAADTLTIDGAVDVREGNLKPFNLAIEVLRGAGTIPALTQLGALIEQKALPKSFYSEETPFDLMRFLMHKEGEGRLIELSRIVMKHSTYLAAAEGSIDPVARTISFKGSLVLSDDLSRELIKNVPRIEILMSDGGRLAFPFLIGGTLQTPKVNADITQMTDKIIAAYRTELIRRGNSRIEVLQ